MKSRDTNKIARAGLNGLAAALCFTLLSFSLLFAEGGRPGEIFNFGAGARPLAMGGAYTAVARDATSVYYNPSGLGLLGGRNLSLMHAALFEGASYDYAGYAQNFGAVPGGWGAQLLRLSAGRAEGRDEFNSPASAFTYSETALSAGAGIRGLLFPLLSVGAGVKIVNRSLGSSSDRLVGVDLGVQYGSFADGRLNLGLVLQNLGGAAFGDTNDRLPFFARAGISYQLVPGLELAADVSNAAEFRIGTEYAIGPGALRLGYDRRSVTFGGGVKFMKAYQLDAAMYRHETLGLSSRISLGYKFGVGDKQEKPRIYAEDFLARAGSALDRKLYLAALEHLDRAIGLDPLIKKGAWGQKGKRLAAFSKGMGLDSDPEREKAFGRGTPQAEEAALAVSAYIEGMDMKAFLLAHGVSGLNTGEALYGEFLNLLARLTGNEVRRDEVLPRSLLVQEKLKKAAAAFYIQKFEHAARQCEEVLLIDGNNPLAWTRLGSAYYMMGDKERARKAYLKAVELDPGDKPTLEFIRIQGWEKTGAPD